MSLYKYVPPERIDIIENQRIRFTQPSDFNDPFDTNPNVTSLADDSSIESFIKESFADEKKTDQMLRESLENELSKYGLTKDSPLINFEALLEELKESYKNIAPSLLRDALQLKDPLIKQTLANSLNDTIGVLSLTEKSDNILMWSHYAASHTGFVIELNDKHAFFDQRRNPGELQGHVKKVNYLKERPQITLYESTLGDEKNRQNWIEKFIWYKSDLWAYEQEWRMIYTFRDKKDIITKVTNRALLFPLPHDCVTGIILGCKMSQENRKRIIALLENKAATRHIKIYEAKEDGRDSRINISELGVSK